MNLKRFMELSERTLSTSAPKEFDLLHAKIGILTEVGEILDIIKKYFWYKKSIDHVHIQEEIGDTLWYMAIILREFPEVGYITNATPEDFGLDNSSSILDWVFKLHEIAARVAQAITKEDHIAERIIVESDSLLTFIYLFCKRYLYDIGKIMDANINKLAVRYPEKYSDLRAVNRDLDNERSTLDNGLS